MTYKDFINTIVSERGYHPNFNKKIKGYEIHHIKPRSLGGNNDSHNLIALTVGEHLMAHTLLFRENQDNKKLFVALYHMSNEIDTQELMKTVDDKEQFMELVSVICKVKELYNISGENNPMYNKHHSEETRKIMRDKKKGMYIGEENPHWGKKHTEEMKQKLSEDRKGGNNPMARKVYCPELDMTFDTVKEAQDYIGVKSGIIACCTNKYNRITAGKHPKTGEKLHWIYAENKIFSNI